MKKKLFNLLSLLLMFGLLFSCTVNLPNNNQNGNEGGGGQTDPEPSPGPIVDNNKTPTIYLAGDSTVKTYNDSQFIGGWGQYLDLFLDDSIKVVNAANGGRSSRSFINEGRLYDIDDSAYSYSFSQNEGKSIESCIKEGDFLFIQFGHNDDNTKISSSYTTIFDRMVPLGEPDEKGIYPVTEGVKTTTSVLPSEYVELASDSEETKALAEIAKYGSTYYAYGSGTYKWYLKQYIDFARSKGAIPVLVTPVARVKFSDGVIIGGAGLHGENFAYVEAVRQLASEEDCLLIDLFKESKEMLEIASSKYANFLMALKPNDLVGNWPSGYDAAYGNTDAGYTGIEATHYNKYGAYLQAAKVIENILTNKIETTKHERFNFTAHILNSPKTYIDPSNLISKNVVGSLESLFAKVTVTNPNRSYPDPTEVVTAIEELINKGEVTESNYLELQTICEDIRNKYQNLNIDDRSQVTNLDKLAEYETAIEELVNASRPTPIKVVTFDADNLTLETYDSSVIEGEFTLVGTSDKTMTKKAKKATFTYAGESYSNDYGLSVGGKASFGKNRYVSFEVEGACTITVVAQSSGSSDRTLSMVDSTNASVGSFAANVGVSVTTIDVDSAGTYSIGSAGSGIYIFMIIIEYFE